MNNLSSIKNIYFIGIGGIGMSALARYFLAKGVFVSGYDKTSTVLTRQLEEEGINIHYEDNISLAPMDADVIVYTPAIPATHTELMYFLEHQYTVVKRSDVLQWITESSFNICIGGTHGKTTVTTMVAHILRHSGYGCNAFLGGISANYQTNFWSSEKNVVVVEADEYDRSFLKLVPDIAVINSMDPDHLDIYGTPEEVENAFIQFSKKVKPGGCLITRFGMNRTNDLLANHHFTYSSQANTADVFASDIRVINGGYKFNVINKHWVLSSVHLPMGGLHNIENCIAAITVAKYLNIEDEKIIDAIAHFKGVKRRFEYLINNGHQILIDDYAHHPEELRALIGGVKSIFPDLPITLIFQPHLFSRTQDLATTFAESLSMADEVILLPIYPARELPIPGITSEWLLNKMNNQNKQVLSKENLLDWVKASKPKLLVMAGAGDIDVIIQKVKEHLLSNETA